MAEYIDSKVALGMLADAAIEAQLYDECVEETIKKCMSIIQRVPVADVQPVVHGKWMKQVESKYDSHTGEYWEEEYYNCSKCDYASDWASPYCPNCGAKMIAEEK